MNVQSLIEELATRGIQLIPRPPKLIAVPAAKLTDKDCEAIRDHKAGLLALLVVRHEQAETDRIARLDAERYEADRHAKRGYDFDPTAPSHAEYVSRANPRAYSIVATCQHHGVALRNDQTTGDLVVGKAGAKAERPTQPWPSLLIAIEVHLEAVASLVEAGWTLRADFPQGDIA